MRGNPRSRNPRRDRLMSRVLPPGTQGFNRPKTRRRKGKGNRHGGSNTGGGSIGGGAAG